MIEWKCPKCGYINNQHKNVRAQIVKCYGCKEELEVDRYNIILKYWHL